jgi:NCS1 family nucleobase:cation symporter-1
MILFSAMGVVITSASKAIMTGVEIKKLFDPVYILSQLTSSTPPPGLHDPLIASSGTRVMVAILAVVGVLIATVSVNIAANVVSPANDFANLAPRRISFKTGGLITGIVGVLMMPWKLLASADTYIFEWLIGYSALLGPIAGIMIADYYVLRKRELDVPDLYRENGRYGRFNPIALVALVVGVAPNVIGFLHATRVLAPPAEKDVWDHVYPYAWFVGFAVAFGVYLGAMIVLKGGARPAATRPG